jgi:uncharacterized protein YbjQ (UPF0145 family)
MGPQTGPQSGPQPPFQPYGQPGQPPFGPPGQPPTGPHPFAQPPYGQPGSPPPYGPPGPPPYGQPPYGQPGAQSGTRSGAQPGGQPQYTAQQAGQPAAQAASQQQQKGAPPQQGYQSPAPVPGFDHSLVTSAFELPAHTIVRNYGLVRGIIVRSRSIFGQIGAGLQQLAGGNISIYTEMCERARQDAYEIMIQHAAQLGANAIIGVRYDATELTQGVTEVLCYGTAVTAVPSRPAQPAGTQPGAAGGSPS